MVKYFWVCSIGWSLLQRYNIQTRSFSLYGLWLQILVAGLTSLPIASSYQVLFFSTCERVLLLNVPNAFFVRPEYKSCVTLATFFSIGVELKHSNVTYSIQYTENTWFL